MYCSNASKYIPGAGGGGGCGISVLIKKCKYIIACKCFKYDNYWVIWDGMK